MKKLKFIDAEGIGKKVLQGDGELNGWFGIGLASKYYSKENLELYAKWASKHLNSFLFVIADDVEKYNLMVFKNMNEKKALEKARKIGDEKFKMVEKTAKKFPHKIEVKRWKELSINKEYQRIFKQLNKDYDEIPVLKKHLDSTLWANIRTKLEDLKAEIGEKKFNKKFRTLVKYTIEEISSIIYLGEYHIYAIKVGHSGERVYDNIVDRIYSKHYNKVHAKILPKNTRGNIYLQIEE